MKEHILARNLFPAKNAYSESPRRAKGETLWGIGNTPKEHNDIMLRL